MTACARANPTSDDADFQKLRDEATERYKELQEKAQPVMKVMEDPEAINKLRSGVDREKNMDMLRSEYGVSDAERLGPDPCPLPLYCC